MTTRQHSGRIVWSWIMCVALLAVTTGCGTGGSTGASSSRGTTVEAPSSDDFAPTGVDTGPRSDLAGSVVWFRIAINGNREERFDFVSDRCTSADLPAGDAAALIPENIVDDVSGDTALVSYDFRIIDHDAPPDPSATALPVKSTTQVIDETWTRSDGVWLWDDC